MIWRPFAVGNEIPLRHGHARGGKHTPEYHAWQNMRQRCGNPRNRRFRNWGGRGIKVCERWADFENFLADMGIRPHGTTLDRRDTNGHYEPGNCRWATPTEQGRNSRRNHLIEHNGERLCLAEWATKLGIAAATIRKRLKLGWPTERALTTPPIPGGHHGFPSTGATPCE
jgi:hypothetical protein